MVLHLVSYEDHMVHCHSYIALTLIMVIHSLLLPNIRVTLSLLITIYYGFLLIITIVIITTVIIA